MELSKHTSMPKLALLAIVLLVAWHNVFAWSFTNYSKITLYELTDDTGRLAIGIAGFSDSTPGCHYTDQFAIFPEEKYYKEAVSTILAAKLANKNIRIAYDPTSCNPIDPNYLNIRYLYIE